MPPHWQCEAVMARGRVCTWLAACWIITHMKGVAAMPTLDTSTSNKTASPVIFYIYPTPESTGTEDIEQLVQSHPLTLVMHGFKGDSTAKSVLAIKQALLLTGVKNVVLVDWGPLSDAPNKRTLDAYHEVRDRGVPTAAVTVADWIKKVQSVKNISPSEVHIVGFSLGAHLAGMVGHMLNSTLGRISALDPPKFGYVATPIHQRLHSSSAQFVNVIHTSSGVLSYPEPIGHVDFFPNGDTLPQPGCPSESPVHAVTCSHYMSFMLFAESVLNPDSLLATECSSWVSFKAGSCSNRSKAPMGYATPNKTRGMFFMKTNEEPPFGGEISSDRPIPEEMMPLLIYNDTESLLNASDVASFISGKLGQDASAPMEGSPADSNGGVMRMKTSSKTSTTKAPPAFQNSSSSRVVISVTLLTLTGYFLRQVL